MSGPGENVALDDLWQTLTVAPFAGVNVLRLDRFDGLAPGNKAFKLKPLIARARAQGQCRLLSFGGPWSNHLHALAALGRAEGLATVGFVRGLQPGSLTLTLNDARQWGMQLIGLDRSSYRRRAETGFQAGLLARYGPGLLIPEGGDCPDGAAGCRVIGEAVTRAFPGGATVLLAVGTGTTLAGVLAALGSQYRVMGISALKGALDIEQRVRHNLQALNIEPAACWEFVTTFTAAVLAA